MVNWIIGIPLLALFASAALAVMVIPSTRREPGRFTLNLLLVLMTLWMFSSVMIHSVAFPSSLFWMYLILLCGISTGVVGVHFSAQFTQLRGQIVKWIVITFYTLCSLAVVLLFYGKLIERAELLPNGAVEVKFGTMAYLMWGMVGIATLVALAILISAYIKSPHSEKKYIIFPVLGFIVMCFGALGNIIFSSYPVDIAANFIFISLLTYGVVGRHLLTPTSRQPQLLSLSVIALVLALCYTAVYIFCVKWLGITASASYLAAAIAIIVFGSITFGPSRMFLSNKLAQLLFPRIYRYQKALNELARVDMSLTQWTNSLNNSLNIIAKATGTDDAVLLVRNTMTKYFEGKYAVGHNQASLLQLSLPIDSSLAKTLFETSAILSTQDIERQIASKILLRGKDDTLQEIGPTLYCGIRVYNGLLAIIALIRKSPYEWNRTEDKDFLELAGRQIAPLIINAVLYRESQLEIEERKQMEKALKESEEKYRLLTESSLAGIFIQQDGRYVYVNDRYAQMHGYKPEELVGMEYWKLIPPELREAARKNVSNALHGEFSYAPQTRQRLKKDGQHFWASLMITASEYKGKPAILGNLIDITEQKRLEEERVEMEKKAQMTSRLASVGEMAAGIAHEINNPLTGVIGYAELLQTQKDLPAHIKKDLETIQQGAQRVADIVRRLLIFARQSKPMRDYVNIHELIQNTLELRAYQLRTGNIEVITEFDPNLTATVADGGQLQQVFLNLIANAEMEMKVAHGRGKLLIKTQKLADTILISFKDDGPGISKENMEKLFSPFFTTKEVGKGTGLGLSICYGIIVEHCGRIWAKSKHGKGATFFVELPIVMKSEQLKMDEPDSEETTKVETAKILVVDDEEVIREFLSRVLTEQGHQVDTTDNAEEALEKINKKRYRLILLDIKMPGMSGMELYKQIRKTAKSLTDRVVFVTGDIMGADTEKFLEKTKAPYITKPIDLGQLRKKLESLLQ